MVCKYCKSEMRLDDVDFNFKGNKDNYFICDNCNALALEKIRYGKSVNVTFEPCIDWEEDKQWKDLILIYHKN